LIKRMESTEVIILRTEIEDEPAPFELSQRHTVAFARQKLKLRGLLDALLLQCEYLIHYLAMLAHDGHPLIRSV
jgi:hypothetical protein